VTVENVGEMQGFFCYLAGYVVLAVGVSKPGQELT
jgi:hypothetical protein